MVFDALYRGAGVGKVRGIRQSQAPGPAGGRVCYGADIV